MDIYIYIYITYKPYITNQVNIINIHFNVPDRPKKKTVSRPCSPRTDCQPTGWTNSLIRWTRERRLEIAVSLEDFTN